MIARQGFLMTRFGPCGKVVARHINITPGLVSQWERGEHQRNGRALTLLSLIKRKGLGVLEG